MDTMDKSTGVMLFGHQLHVKCSVHFSKEDKIRVISVSAELKCV